MMWPHFIFVMMVKVRCDYFVYLDFYRYHDKRRSIAGNVFSLVDDVVIRISLMVTLSSLEMGTRQLHMNVKVFGYRRS